MATETSIPTVHTTWSHDTVKRQSTGRMLCKSTQASTLEHYITGQSADPLPICRPDQETPQSLLVPANSQTMNQPEPMQLTNILQSSRQTLHRIPFDWISARSTRGPYYFRHTTPQAAPHIGSRHSYTLLGGCMARTSCPSLGISNLRLRR